MAGHRSATRGAPHRARYSPPGIRRNAPNPSRPPARPARSTRSPDAGGTPDPLPALPLPPPPVADAAPPPSTFAETPVDITVAPKPIAPYLSAMSVQPPAGSPHRAPPLVT